MLEHKGLRWGYIFLKASSYLNTFLESLPGFRLGSAPPRTASLQVRNLGAPATVFLLLDLDPKYIGLHLAAPTVCNFEDLVFHSV